MPKKASAPKPDEATTEEVVEAPAEEQATEAPSDTPEERTIESLREETHEALKEDPAPKRGPSGGRSNGPPKKIRVTDPIRKFTFKEDVKTPTHKFLAGHEYHVRFTDAAWQEFVDRYQPKIVK